MASPVDTPLVCPTIVGRAPYLTALDGQMDAAQAGHGATIVVTGEAGVGKSRLVAEARTRATQRGMRVLVGRAFEPDRVLPYAPLRDLLRAYLAGPSADAPFRAFASVALALASHVPELARSLPDSPAPALLDPAQEQRQIVHAWVQFAIELATDQPLLILIEDVHWADDASLEVLLTLARQLAARPILLVLTERSDETTPSVRHLLAQLDRERLAAEMALSRLTLREVDTMLRAVFDQRRPIRADFLQAIFALTDGNPFFIEEVLRALVAAGDIFRADGHWERRTLTQLHIPRSVQDAVLRRTTNLSPAAAQVLRLAAVAGRRFDFDVLRALTGQDEEALLERIRELVTAQLVVEESAERFAFRHALTRQAIAATLLARERRALHLGVAQALEQLHAATPEPYFADLSYHFTAGEAWEKAMEYGERAGTRALALYAPQAAVEHFSRALDAAAHRSVAPAARLYRERGRARTMLGDFDGALADYQAALARAQADGDRLGEWQALLDLGGLWVGYDYARAGEYFASALTLAQDLDDPAGVAESLMQLGGWYLNTERVDEAEASLQAALAIFEAAGDRRGIARSVDLLGTVSDIAGDIIQMRRRYERAASLFRELGDRQGLCSTLATMLIAAGGYIFETVVIPPHISARDAQREADEAITLAHDIGWRSGEAYVIGTAALSFGSYGMYGRALQAVREGLAIAQEIDHREWMTATEWTYGVLCTDLLDLPRAEEYLRRAREIASASGSLHWAYLLAGYLAENRVMQGDPDGADAALSTIPPNLPMRTLGQRRVWVARAKIAEARNDAAGALAIVDGLFANAANYTGTQNIPLLALLRGQSLMALDRYAEAEESFQAALRITTDRGLLPFCWRSHLALGRLYAMSNRVAASRTHFQSAWTIIEGLAPTLPDDVRDRFLSAAAALLPADRAIRARRDGGLLTGRERDVATLVARGLSSREIAETLSIGERTVETHVGNILSKLGFGSRAQIAAWAVETGLGRPAE